MRLCLPLTLMLTACGLVTACSSGGDPGEAVGAADAAAGTAAGERDSSTLPVREEDACTGGAVVGEFVVDCVWTDAGANAPAADAQAPAPDAGSQEVDANTPDAGEQACGDAPYACENERLRPLAAGATCTLIGTSGVEVAFDVCQDCGTERTTFATGLVFRTCDSCEQVYATRGASGLASLSSGECTRVRYASADGVGYNGASGPSCVDVFASTQSATGDDGQGAGASYRPEQLVQVCRCNGNARFCEACGPNGCHLGFE